MPVERNTSVRGTQIRNFSITSNDIQAGAIEPTHLIEEYVTVSGSRGFIDTVSGVSPTEPYHLTTKSYVDTAISGGVGITDHGDLNGLDGDDHTQYILADGTRAFTGTVSGTVVVGGVLGVLGTTKTDGRFYAGSSDPSNTTRLNYDGYFYATRVYNAVWNDVADFQPLANGEAVVYGKCYRMTADGIRMCNEFMQIGIAGIASDTFGFGVGDGDNKVPIAIAGWVLAYVDNVYPIGTPLTCGDDGSLTEMQRSDVSKYPERLVAVYQGMERGLEYGPEGHTIKVNGRHWVKVK